MKLFLIALFLGMFIGYMIADLLSVESKISYSIKRLRAKKGSTIQVEAEAVQSAKTGREQRKEDREATKNDNKLARKGRRLEKKL